jgi:hypothetical protein
MEADATSISIHKAAPVRYTLAKDDEHDRSVGGENGNCHLLFDSASLAVLFLIQGLSLSDGSRCRTVTTAGGPY